MSDNSNQPVDREMQLDEIIPFQVDELDIRGRVMQLGPSVDEILSNHAYPDVVSRLLGELIILTALVGSSLKFEGRLIVQTQSDGTVPLMVVDYRTPGDLRAYARFDEGLREAPDNTLYNPVVLMGKGAMAMTIDQGTRANRYQGIVAMDGSNLEDIASQYFRQSEQIPTRIRLAVAQLFDENLAKPAWQAGGLLAQYLPSSSTPKPVVDLPGGDDPKGDNIHPDIDALEEENWAHARSLVETIADDELTDPQISSKTLLYRLFNETGVRVYDPLPVAAKCSCSREKLADVLWALTKEERQQALEDSEIAGTFATKCEFCSSKYLFSPDEFENERI